MAAWAFLAAGLADVFPDALVVSLAVSLAEPPFADAPERPVVVHGVGHAVHAPVSLPGWPDADRTSRLVLIVRDLDPGFVGKLWDAFLGRPRIDAPDAAALADNPLAPPGF